MHTNFPDHQKDCGSVSAAHRWLKENGWRQTSTRPDRWVKALEGAAVGSDGVIIFRLAPT